MPGTSTRWRTSWRAGAASAPAGRARAGDALAHVVAAGDRFGAGGAAAFEKVDVEFVSANPTGPLHVGHARNAAVGDALSRLFSFVGHDVTREYYINDFGSQVANFGRSVQARARGEEVPEDGY